MFDAFEQDTEAQDKAILALKDKATSVAALNLIHATRKELELQGQWALDGYVLMIAEAILEGIHTDDLAEHFRREAAAAQARTEEKHALVKRLDGLLKARRNEVRAHDLQLETMVKALRGEAARLEGVVILAKDRDERMKRLKAAAEASGADITAVLNAVPPPIDEAEVLTRSRRMAADAGMAMSVKDDPLRRLDVLPEWMRESIPTLTPGDHAAAIALVPY